MSESEAGEEFRSKFQSESTNKIITINSMNSLIYYYQKGLTPLKKMVRERERERESMILILYLKMYNYYNVKNTKCKA